MKHSALTSIILAIAALAASPLPAHAQTANGVWRRDDGRSRIRIAPCGANLCGTIVWLADKNSPAKIGQRVLFNMKSSGANSWSGNAFNPEDGRNYTGKMTLSGARLTTSGCVMGGRVCRSMGWRRVN